jgi:hypothetical protein
VAFGIPDVLMEGPSIGPGGDEKDDDGPLFGGVVTLLDPRPKIGVRRITEYGFLMPIVCKTVVQKRIPLGTLSVFFGSTRVEGKAKLNVQAVKQILGRFPFVGFA